MSEVEKKMVDSATLIDKHRPITREPAMLCKTRSESLDDLVPYSTCVAVPIPASPLEAESLIVPSVALIS